MPYTTRVRIPDHSVRRIPARGFTGERTESLVADLGNNLQAALAARDNGVAPTQSEFWRDVRNALGAEPFVSVGDGLAIRIADGGIALLPRVQLQDRMVGDHPVPWESPEDERPPLAEALDQCAEAIRARKESIDD